MVSIIPLNSIDEDRITFKNDIFDNLDQSKTKATVKIDNKTDHIVAFRIRVKCQYEFCVKPSNYIILEPMGTSSFESKFLLYENYPKNRTITHSIYTCASAINKRMVV